MRGTRHCCLLLAFAFLGTSLGAAPGDWIRRHKRVVDRQGIEQAEYTHISMSDSNASAIRVLYEDPLGALLVLRTNYDKVADTHLLRIKSVATGELLEFDMTPVEGQSHFIVMRLGSQTMSFSDDERKTTAVRSAAEQVFEASASPSFESALRHLTEVGGAHCLDLHGFARSLHDLLFFDQEMPPAPDDREIDVEDPVVFDPNLTPPNEFDARFGEDYYH